MSSASHDAAEIQKHVKTYVGVFAALAVLTLVTVAVSTLHLPVAGAIILAMIIASIKGGLVAGYFMHLVSEKVVIYWVLGITVFMFGVLLLLPVLTSSVHARPGDAAPAHATSEHASPAH